MDKNIIKKYLNDKFLSEAEVNGAPGVKLAKEIGKKNEKVNKDGVKAIGKDMKDYEKSLKQTDSNQKTMTQNKFNYTNDKEKTYHDEMEIMNGQEMIKYDRTPDERFQERALEAIEGSSRMGNNPEWANVVAKGQGGDPEFGKNLVKSIKDSQKKRATQSPTVKMYGDDWEVIKDTSAKSYAFENTKGKKVIKENREDLIDFTIPEWAMSSLINGDDSGLEDEDIRKIEDFVNSVSSRYGNAEFMLGDMEGEDNLGFCHDNDIDDLGSNCYRLYIRPSTEGMNEQKINKNKTEIKESMKRLKFKKEFNGVGNAIKLIPEHYRVDKKIFEMTDGNESYRIRWEGSKEEGTPVILIASDKNLVNEDIQRMKQLFNYKSQETLGTLKGKERINENQAFEDVWKKTKSLMNETEDIEDADATTGDADDAVSHAPEAKKHVSGKSTSDKGTQAPAPKSGNPDDAVGHAPEASKHVKGSSSQSKGTEAPAVKTAAWEKAKVKHAPEAKKHVKMSESVKKKD